MSVRARFTLTVVAIVATTVVLFAALSIAVLDRTLRSNFESRLHSTALTIASTVDVHHGELTLDPSDLRSIESLLAGTRYAVLRANGSQLAGDAPPAASTRGVQRVNVPAARDDRVLGTVEVWQSTLWIDDFDREAAIVSLAVGLLLIALATIASSRVARRVLAPVGEIASLAERIEEYDLSARLRADGTDELGRLCASFDRMLDRLESAFDRERRFVADASHELRAPLAVLRAETELALRRERTPPEYRAALESIKHEAARLDELVDELLAMARAGVEARAARTLDAGELLRSLGERVRPAAAARGMEVRVDAGEAAFAQAHRPTMERALLAIAHNAIAYGRDDGTLALRAVRDNGLVRIEIADDGPGFTPAALAHATERFGRGDIAHPRGGTGLGLAIARTIVEANRGTLQLSNGSDGGALVTIELAASPESAEPA